MLSTTPYTTSTRIVCLVLICLINTIHLVVVVVHNVWNSHLFTDI
jgi:hypothetical protein